MKLVDLQRIAPEGARIVLSCNRSRNGARTWLEVEELQVKRSDYPEVLMRVDVLRHKGPDRSWRIQVFPHHVPGPLVPAIHEWAPVAPRDGGESSEPSRTVWIELLGELYGVTPSDDGAALFDAVMLALASGSTTIPEGDVYTNVHQVSEALLCAMLRAIVHSSKAHSEAESGSSINLCPETSLPLYCLAKLYIQAHDLTVDCEGEH